MVNRRKTWTGLLRHCDGRFVIAMIGLFFVISSGVRNLLFLPLCSSVPSVVKLSDYGDSPGPHISGPLSPQNLHRADAGSPTNLVLVCWGGARRSALFLKLVRHPELRQ